MLFEYIEIVNTLGQRKVLTIEWVRFARILIPFLYPLYSWFSKDKTTHSVLEPHYLTSMSSDIGISEITFGAV